MTAAAGKASTVRGEGLALSSDDHHRDPRREQGLETNTAALMIAIAVRARGGPGRHPVLSGLGSSRDFMGGYAGAAQPGADA